MFDRLRYFLPYLLIRILSFNYLTIRRVISDILKGEKYNGVLDFGCGIGILAPLFSPKQYLGFDIDAGAIAYAKNKYPEYSFQVGDATELNLDKKFDLVVVVGVLHHLNDRELQTSLQVMKSLLVPNGKIVLIEAIPPIYKWNILGQILRILDRGHYVRDMKGYRSLINDDLKIEKQYKKRGGIFDYGVFIIRPKVGKA